MQYLDLFYTVLNLFISEKKLNNNHLKILEIFRNK